MGQKQSSSLGTVTKRHGFGEAAALTLLEAMQNSHGAMAQFSHPELGGMGQWSRGGMLMIGDMFNHDLKARVGALANDLARGFGNNRDEAEGCVGRADGRMAPLQPMGSERWWPEELGVPASAGAQNGARYAVFPDKRRLAVERDGRVSVHDTGENRISAVSQQQGATASLRFSGDRGTVELADLPEV